MWGEYNSFGLVLFEMLGFVIVDINASDGSMSAKSIVKVVTWKEFLSIV